jgi:hypothetical protein
VLVTFCFFFAPGFGTVLYFRQQNLYGLSNPTIGTLGGIGSAFGLLASLAYFFVRRKWGFRNVAVLGIILSAAGNFLYLLYSKSFLGDALIEAQGGVFSAVCIIVLYEVAARSTPIGCEGLGYAFLVGFRNFGVLGADWAGSFLSEHKMKFWQLVSINSGVTILALLFLPFLPSAILRAKEDTDVAPPVSDPEPTCG